MGVVDLKALKAQASETDIYKEIRSDLEDSVKEYSELDLIVEILQNALDAMDERRYREICNTVGVKPDDESTISGWNQTITELMQEDYESFPRDGASKRAVWQSQMSIEPDRRKRWAATLVKNLSLDEAYIEVIETFAPSWAKLRVEVHLGASNRIVVRDAGIGIFDPLEAFRHKGSSKRRGGSPRRLGMRGSHGWGLTAILGLSNRVEVTTKVAGGAPKGILLQNFSDFRSRTGADALITVAEGDELSGLGLLQDIDGESGTIISVTLPTAQNSGLLGALMAGGTIAQWATALRLYTPVGQVNDYVLHPAFHCFRKSDLKVELLWSRNDVSNSMEVEYDYLRLKDIKPDKCVDLPTYVDGGMVAGKSVYCVGRESAVGNFYLAASEIQASKPTLQAIEEDSDQLLIEYSTEAGDAAPLIPRGIFLALSGGMRSEYVALSALSTNAAFRGIILAESAQPTLGRKYTLDQRTAIPNAAKSFTRAYEDVRKSTIPSGQPVLSGPALNKWQRNLWKNTLTELEMDPPFADINIWAATASGEAKVMLTYAELLGRDLLGDVRVLRCALKDIYDFQFVYRWKTGDDGSPSGSHSQTLVQNGFVDRDGDGYRRLAIGEFKAQGDSVLKEFDATGTDWRKNPNSIDLLVCWDFDESGLDESWTSALSKTNYELVEFPRQTHVWIPAAGAKRTRPLAVIALKTLLDQLVETNVLEGVDNWRSDVGDNYYD